jgi:thiamine biosynthesis lipoprotein
MYRVTRPAMNCLFGVTLPDDAPSHDRLAASEALREAERLEGVLSRFIPHSDIARLNAAAGRQYVLVEPATQRLLRTLVALVEAVDGAFDPTVGPLVALWKGAPRPPTAEDLAAAQERVGIEGLVFEPDGPGVGLVAEGMSLDLGGVGKGYAVGEVAACLTDLGVKRALVDGGTSSAQAIGAWRAAIADPVTPESPLATVPLADGAVAVSGTHGQGFTFEGQWYGHVLDPRTGAPTRGPRLAAVLHPSPVTAEVLSTALLVAGGSLLSRLGERFPEAEAWLLREDGQTLSTPGWPGATNSQ